MNSIAWAFRRDIYRRQLEALFQFSVVPVGEVIDEAITLIQARAHCRVDTHEEGSPPATVSDDDDWLLDIGIPTAREYCEALLGRALAPRTLELAAASFPSAGFLLPFGPVQSITSVKYLDQAIADAAYTAAYDIEFLISADVALATAAGVAAAAAVIEQTVAPTVYALDTYTTPARLILTTGSTWPTPNGTANSVKVRYVVGYSIPDTSPQVYVLPKLGLAMMLLTLGHLYINREATADKTVIEMPLGVAAMAALFPGRENLGMA